MRLNFTELWSGPAAPRPPSPRRPGALPLPHAPADLYLRPPLSRLARQFPVRRALRALSRPLPAVGGGVDDPLFRRAIWRGGDCRLSGRSRQIGRASCRESGSQYVEIAVVAESLKTHQDAR